MRKSVVTLLLALGCAHAQPRAAQCNPIAGLDAVLKPGNLVFFGELHGTNEIPAFVGDVACAAVAAGLPVHVGLELPAADGPLWSAPFQSGRTSLAMRGLIERLRSLNVPLFWFDSEAPDRDAAMADNISAERRKAPGDLYLLLAGNLHARKKAGAPWDEKIRWTAVHLAEREPRLITLDVSYRPGTAWICSSSSPSDCGAVKAGGKADAASAALTLAPQADGYDGIYSVGTISASPPAEKTQPK